MEENHGALMFRDNTAKNEGQSVDASDLQNCFSRSTLKNITATLAPHINLVSLGLVLMFHFNFAFLYHPEVMSNEGNILWRTLQHE